MNFKQSKTEDRHLQSPRVIVCEGSDEFDILTWICKQRGLSEGAVEILNAEGRTKLPTYLRTLRFQSGGSGVALVAVVLDAEERSDSDQALLQNLETIAQTQGFGYLFRVLPDADSVGALETLVRRHVDAGSAASSCADAWETCLTPSIEARTTAQKDKAWGKVWLAGQGVSQSRVGLALRQRADVRERLNGVVQHFEALLDEVLKASLN